MIISFTYTIGEVFWYAKGGVLVLLAPHTFVVAAQGNFPMILLLVTLNLASRS